YMAYFLSDGLTKEVEENKNYGGICTIFDEDYPALLKEIYNPPLVFFYNGNFSLLNAPTLAIVGARKHSPYAKEVLKKLLPDVLKVNADIGIECITTVKATNITELTN
ncbi:DNA-processing protein DprA, partial [Ligilactobacillus salivarius]